MIPRVKKLDDPDVQERLFEYLRLGHGRLAALNAISINPGTFRLYWRDPANVEFRARYEEAIDDSVEPVLQALREIALDGDVSAIKTYLSQMAPAPRAGKAGDSKVEVTVKHELDVSKISSIRELEAMVRERTAPQLTEGAYNDDEEIIEAEIIEE